MLKLTHKMGSRGDTIVEVMIALAIIGSVLGLAYATTARALRLGRQAQESTEAVKVAESQIEQLKSYKEEATSVQKDVLYPTTSSTTFCVAQVAVNDPALTIRNNFLLSIPALNGASLAAQDPIPSTANPYHTSCAVGSNSRYFVAIAPPSDPNNPVFTIYVRWERDGGGRDELITRYRLYR